MFKKFWFALIVFLLAIFAARPAHAADMLDLHQATVHSSPADVADWPVTATISHIAMAPDVGMTLDVNAPDAWNYHVPGWGTGTSCPGDGCIQYTVWLVVNINGQWHTAGFVQMWQGRGSTGKFETPSWTTEYGRNWAYDSVRWGTMTTYQPKAGDTMGVLVTAGNARQETSVTSVRERSNVITVTLPADATTIPVTGFDAPPPPVAAPPPAPAPTPPPAATDAVLAAIADLKQQQTDDTAKILAAIADLKQDIHNGIRQIGDTYLPLVFGFLGKPLPVTPTTVK